MSGKQISLPLHDLSVGAVVTELVRAYLYTGNPREALAALKNALDGDQRHLRELEDRLYELYPEPGE
jgi:hypothetical protein